MSPFWSLFKKPAADAASTLIGSVTSMIDEVVTNKEERETLKLAAQKQVQDYTVRIEELAQASEKMFLEDKQSARDMQKAALEQTDLFSKRFVYYLALGLIGATILFDYFLLFKEIPTANKDMVNTIAGMLNSGGVIAIVQFFFGSSKGSSDKQDLLNTLHSTK